MIKNALIIVFAMTLLLTPVFAFAQTLGTCTCPNITASGGALDRDACQERFAGAIGAGCDWNDGTNQCVCSKTFATQMEQDNCVSSADSMLEAQYSGEYLNIVEELGITVTGNCTWRSAERPGDTTGETDTDGGTAPPAERIELQPPFGQAGQSGDVFIQEIVGVMINWALGIIGSIALLMFVAGGFIWLTSAGSPDKIKMGKGIIVWSVLGLVIIFASYAISRFILQALLG